MSKAKGISSESALANSMTDLMTSLAVVFILLLVAYLNQAYMENKQRSERYKQLIGRSKTVKTDLLTNFNKIGIEATADQKDPLSIVIPISEAKIRFDTARAEIRPEGKQVLREFVPQLAAIICDPNVVDDIESVLIEGHTDASGDDETNLKLSQDRSYSVLRFVLNDCSLQPEERIRLLDLVSANGRGERHPVDLHNNAPNRRVVFKIRVKSIEQRHVILG